MNRTTPTRSTVQRLLGLALIAALSMLSGCSDKPLSSEQEPLDTIAFGSCARSDRTQSIWTSIVAQEPDLFLFIGDNVYVDIPDIPDGPEDFKEKYDQLAAKPGWQALRGSTPVLAIWDDHDFGLNDAGKEFALKDVAQEQFIDFFEPAADSRMRTAPGIYDAYTIGPEGRRVQVILLDTRYFRDPLTRNPRGRVNGRGPYIPNPDDQGTLLGEAQWAWLEAQLQQPADLRIIASSIQVVADEHGWETWGNLPHERRRLYELIHKHEANGVVFISGDRHLIEISVDDEPGVPYPMWDFTSSGFNWGQGTVREPNRHRRGPVLRKPNFGVIRVDWDQADPLIRFEGRDHEGEVLLSESVRLSELQVGGR